MIDLILTLVLVLFLLLMMFGAFQLLSLVAARRGGWSALARAYRAAGPPAGKQIKLQRVSVGGVIYKDSITVGIGDPGLHLRTTVLGRLCHAPLLIPWDVIREAKAEDLAKFFAQALVGATVDKGLLIRLGLKEIGQGLNDHPHLKLVCFEVPLPGRDPVAFQLLIDVREIRDRLGLP